jgi:hypothetical protein
MVLFLVLIILVNIFLIPFNITHASYTKSIYNPVLTTSESGWDSSIVGNPSILTEVNKYIMLYTGS